MNITRYFKFTYPQEMDEQFSHGLKIHRSISCAEILMEPITAEGVDLPEDVEEPVASVKYHDQTEPAPIPIPEEKPKRKRRTKEEPPAFTPMPATCFPEPFDNGAPTPDEDDW